MLINHVAFIFLTLHSTVCSMNKGSCHITVGVSAEAFVSFVLDVLSLVYITGSLSFLVSSVNDDIRNLYRKLLIVLLYLCGRSLGTEVTCTVIAVVAGRVGDLFKSLLKRAAEVKDSGKLISEHGGALDRIDALLFALVVFARYCAFHT
ncbi:unnamed protein product [Peronospora destructor]|uniref:Phosphatidate cytidylyltransferase n=1 Tax=Peronospora destructor TaxID=86335 RepID=A0AAV0UKI9_9STRA|nr:unnamed protein product [Peronospora destructor]